MTGGLSFEFFGVRRSFFELRGTCAFAKRTGSLLAVRPSALLLATISLSSPSARVLQRVPSGPDRGCGRATQTRECGSAPPQLSQTCWPRIAGMRPSVRRVPWPERTRSGRRRPSHTTCATMAHAHLFPSRLATRIPLAPHGSYSPCDATAESRANFWRESTAQVSTAGNTPGSSSVKRS